MSLPPNDDDDWGGSWGVPVDEELPPPPRPPEPAPPTPAAGHGFGSWQSSATKGKKKGKKGAAVVKKPQFQETLKMVPTRMVLPPFPEMRRTRAFDDSKGNGLHLIEIGEGIAKGTMVTEDSVRDYIAHDFHANRSPRSAVSEESTKLL
ncbi:hypothetical protein SLS60_010412 [Paraconiothyrium brasiliense]|uniref:Uncharacterized protein n=1 Tax=Paraconiothyrium brasiliense TaxID=300254 RepID=A0ABR3QNF0_9PLEO